jgi:hypothetical protein
MPCAEETALHFIYRVIVSNAFHGRLAPLGYESRPDAPEGSLMSG